MDYKVLIVDDNENNRFTLKSVLQSMDVESIEAKNGSEALECVMKYDIDLIILDIQLPDISGFDIAKMIKSRKSTMSIPIIFATAVFKSEEYILKGFELGAVDYILKPLNVDMIISKVSYYKSITIERKNLINKLELKNNTLNNINLELSNTKSLLEQAIGNWETLGSNIPFTVELYDKNNKVIFMNKSEPDVLKKKLYDLNLDKIISQIELTRKNKKMVNNVYTVETGEGINYLELKSILVDKDSSSFVMLIINDITQQKKRVDGIQYKGYHDQLTGLWNRHYFTEYVSLMDIENALPLSVLMADVNGLKLINDGFGHTAGDELIKATAECLRDCTNQDAIIARWGGDEFLLLLPSTSNDRMQQISRLITKKIGGQKINDKFPVSMALGVATSENPKLVLEVLIKEAEDKMYVNKMQNQSSYRSFIVESLKGALYEQDYETKEHTERISDMALIVAEHLQMSQNEKDKLVLLGSLHDIGKIGISSSILKQSNKLSDIDWNIIKRHPEIGYRICNAVPELSSIADLILAHHEKWDGTGYPRRLKGTEIPLLARLVSILDTFDVITHDRPYKKASSPEWALEEIKRCSGTQFDPNLVHVFEHVYIKIIESGIPFDE